MLTSGTLPPLHTLTRELGVGCAVALRNTHVVGKESVFARIITGNGVPFNGSYATRTDVKYLKGLGEFIGMLQLKVMCIFK